MQNEFTEARSTKTFIDNIVAFYKKNKFFIILSIFILLFLFLATVFYLHAKEKKIQLTANLYISAKTDLNNNQKAKAKDTLIKIIESNNPTYSTLSLFLLIDANLMDDERKLIKLFDHILSNNKFEKEIENLIIFKKALSQSNYVDEIELITTLNPLINSETLWRSHALLLLGDYFFSKGEFSKAKENYLKILSLTDPNDLQDQAKYRLQLQSND